MFQNSVQLGNTFASPNLMSRQQKLNNLLFDLKEEHRLLDKEVTELTRSYVAPEVLKRHKKMKLAMKDRILAIEVGIPSPLSVSSFAVGFRSLVEDLALGK